MQTTWGQRDVLAAEIGTGPTKVKVAVGAAGVLAGLGWHVEEGVSE